jgi:crotonobetainyl-CoA:carnitine CoA-transferase CaiB-like acyl-CoA transferase
MAQMLEGIRVLDATRHVAGPFATKILADYGADVVKVEPPEGDPARRQGPFFHDDPHPEKSALFLHLNTNKRSVTLDLGYAEGRAIFRRLAAECDVVLEDGRPGQFAEWGLDWETLSEGRDDLVMASITPFGQSGPYRDYRGSEIALQAMGGPLHLNGTAEREPLKLGGYVANYHAGAATALALMLARFRVEMGGEGDYIDLAIYECQAGFRDRRTIYLTGASYTGWSAKRQRSGMRMATGVRPCLDGYVNLLAGAPRHLDPFLRLIGRADLIEHPDIHKNLIDIPPELVEEVEASYLGWLMQTPKREVVAQTQALGILGGAIQTTEDLISDPHYRGRGVWETIDHPATGPVQYPGRQLVLSETPKQPSRHAPLLGEHNEEVLCGRLGYSRDDLTRLRAQGAI